MIRLFLSESLISLHPDSVLNLPDTCQFFLSPTKYIPVRFSRVAICMQQSISPSPPSHSPTRRAIPDVHIYIYIYVQQVEEEYEIGIPTNQSRTQSLQGTSRYRRGKSPALCRVPGYYVT